jgi:hypothetical protein
MELVLIITFASGGMDMIHVVYDVDVSTTFHTQ